MLTGAQWPFACCLAEGAKDSKDVECLNFHSPVGVAVDEANSLFGSASDDVELDCPVTQLIATAPASESSDFLHKAASADAVFAAFCDRWACDGCSSPSAADLAALVRGCAGFDATSIADACVDLLVVEPPTEADWHRHACALHALCHFAQGPAHLRCAARAALEQTEWLIERVAVQVPGCRSEAEMALSQLESLRFEDDSACGERALLLPRRHAVHATSSEGSCAISGATPASKQEDTLQSAVFLYNRRCSRLMRVQARQEKLYESCSSLACGRDDQHMLQEQGWPSGEVGDEAPSGVASLPASSMQLVLV
mmetsp:Transcript_127285/g.368535  ORF Transcript_127285/g.368535 Transcript_127285/m.368535 type:complete len:312 (+) Transcript_127285:59-994(+)